MLFRIRWFVNRVSSNAKDIFLRHLNVNIMQFSLLARHLKTVAVNLLPRAGKSTLYQLLRCEKTRLKGANFFWRLLEKDHIFLSSLLWFMLPFLPCFFDTKKAVKKLVEFLRCENVKRKFKMVYLTHIYHFLNIF